MNGDGFDDVALGAYKFNGSTGRAYVFMGSAAGVMTSPAWTATGEESPAGFGASLAAAGDVTGDGIGDVIVGAQGHAEVGRAYLYAGSSAGLTATATTFDGIASGDQFAWSVDGAGDVDADGIEDLLISSPGYDGRVGRVLQYAGSATGLLAPTIKIDGTCQDCWFGAAVDGAGDIDGDGYDDVVVGEYRSPETNPTGRIHLFNGGAAGVASAATISLDGETAGDEFGRHLAGAGDVDGDDFADVIVGASHYAEFTGRAYLYLGYADVDGDSVAAAKDCDDTDASVGVASARYTDADGDGYGTSTSATACPGAPGYADNTLDCDDTDAAVPFVGSTWVGCGSAASIVFTGPWSYPATGAIGVASNQGATVVSCAGLVGGTGASKSVTTTPKATFRAGAPTTANGVITASVEGAVYGCVVDLPNTTVTTSPAPLTACGGDQVQVLVLRRITVDTNRTPAVVSSYVVDLTVSAGSEVRYLPTATEISTVTAGNVSVSLTWGDVSVDVGGVSVTLRMPTGTAVTAGPLSHSDVTAYSDEDGDLLPDLDEVDKFGTDPTTWDSDTDGISDGVEIISAIIEEGGGEPVTDADADGLDLIAEFLRGTDPLLDDTDGDGVGDLDEIGDGTSPTDADSSAFADTDASGVDDRYEDLDGDGLTGATETAIGTDAEVADTDGDGVNDGDERTAGTDPLVDERPAADTAAADEGEAPVDESCGCASSAPRGALGLALALVAAGRRRRT